MENLNVVNDYFSSSGTLTCNVASVNVLSSISLSCDTVPPGIVNVQCFLNNGFPIDCMFYFIWEGGSRPSLEVRLPFFTITMCR